MYVCVRLCLLVSHTSPSIYVCASLSLCLCLSSSVVSSRRCLHNVPSSSFCDFAERGPGSGCHPLPPSQHCPGTLDQRDPATHRLPALPHQPAPHLHGPAIWGAGTSLRKHRALLPGVQRADGPLQRIWVCWVHEEGLCFTGPFWAAGPTAGMLEWLLNWSCHDLITWYCCYIYKTERCWNEGSIKGLLFLLTLFDEYRMSTNDAF